MPVAVPALSSVGRADFNNDVRARVNQAAGVWFDEPVKELSMRSARYDLNYTLLHLGNEGGGFCAGRNRMWTTRSTVLSQAARQTERNERATGFSSKACP
jgi:hypothetical protein